MNTTIIIIVWFNRDTHDEQLLKHIRKNLFQLGDITGVIFRHTQGWGFGSKYHFIIALVFFCIYSNTYFSVMEMGFVNCYHSALKIWKEIQRDRNGLRSLLVALWHHIFTKWQHTDTTFQLRYHTLGVQLFLAGWG